MPAGSDMFFGQHAVFFLCRWHFAGKLAPERLYRETLSVRYVARLISTVRFA